MNTIVTINMNNAALCRLEQQARTGLDATPLRIRTQLGQPLNVQGSRTNVARQPQSLAGLSASPRPTARPTTV
ncbi:hypothetical protein [Kocuria sp. CPCC 205263]|uniref:hypothetical protein n=1 Tax=Kocuria sp. CPCC 205263 TaxID=3073555 RepID=UPI0034D4389C